MFLFSSEYSGWSQTFVFLKSSRCDSDMHQSFLTLGYIVSKPLGLRDFPELSSTPPSPRPVISHPTEVTVNVCHSLWARKGPQLSFQSPEASLRIFFYIINLTNSQ